MFQYVERLAGPCCIFCGDSLNGPAILHGAFDNICMDCAYDLVEVYNASVPKDEDGRPRKRGRRARRSK